MPGNDRKEAPEEILSPEVELELEILGKRARLASEEESGAGHELRKRQMLIVDDDPGLRGYARRCIERAFGGLLEVSEAEDGIEALYVAREGGLDVIMCDVYLPRMGGLELLAELRGDPALAAIRVLLTTGESLGRAERKRVDELPGVKVLPKPFNARKLCESIEALLD
jgi:CheY-like chemotaxis protein